MKKIFIIIVLLTISFLQSYTSSCIAEPFDGLRDCVVWIKGGEGDQVTVSWKDWYAGESTINYIYFQAPNGELVEKIKIPYGEQQGSQSLKLSKGSGDYRLEMPGYFYRNASIQVSENVKIVLEPAKYHFSLHADEKYLFFNVPSNAKSFTLCGRYYGGADSILLYDPDGNLQSTLDLTTQPENFKFDKI